MPGARDPGCASRMLHHPASQCPQHLQTWRRDNRAESGKVGRKIEPHGRKPSTRRHRIVRRDAPPHLAGDLPVLGAMQASRPTAKGHAGHLDWRSLCRRWSVQRNPSWIELRTRHDCLPPTNLFQANSGHLLWRKTDFPHFPAVDHAPRRLYPVIAQQNTLEIPIKFERFHQSLRGFRRRQQPGRSLSCRKPFAFRDAISLLSFQRFYGCPLLSAASPATRTFRNRPMSLSSAVAWAGVATTTNSQKARNLRRPHRERNDCRRTIEPQLGLVSPAEPRSSELPLARLALRRWENLNSEPAKKPAFAAPASLYATTRKADSKRLGALKPCCASSSASIHEC